MKKHKGIVPSMLQDIRNGKMSEVDAINGVVCDWGRKVGVATPINDRIVELIKLGQNGEITLNRDNVRRFDDVM